MLYYRTIQTPRRPQQRYRHAAQHNQTVATKRCLCIFKGYPTVRPGSIITLKMDEERVQKELEPKEKMDFETTVSKTLSVLTSSLSIILLVKSLNN